MSEGLLRGAGNWTRGEQRQMRTHGCSLTMTVFVYGRRFARRRDSWLPYVSLVDFNPLTFCMVRDRAGLPGALEVLVLPCCQVARGALPMDPRIGDPELIAPSSRHVGRAPQALSRIGAELTCTGGRGRSCTGYRPICIPCRDVTVTRYGHPVHHGVISSGVLRVRS